MGRPTILQISERSRSDLYSAMTDAKENNDLGLYQKCKAICLIGEEHLPQNKVAHYVDAKPRTVRSWVKKFMKEGIAALVGKPHPGATPRLNQDQLLTLKSIVQKGPEEYGLETGVWTAMLIREVIKGEFDVIYDISQVRRILHKLDFSVQYPRESLSKADLNKQFTWLHQTFPEIKKKAAEEGGEVFFEDEVIFYQRGSTTRTWAEVGTGTIVKSAPGRKSKKAFGAVSLSQSPKFHFRFEEDKFNGVSFQKFLEQITRGNRDRKVFMILDNAKYHHAKAIQPWLEKNKHAVELFFLPSYSPNLNPIERVWKKTKKASIHNRYFGELEDLHREIFRRFNRFQGNPASLRGSVQDFL